MGNVPPANQHRLAHEHEEIPAENAPVQSPTELNLNSLIKIQNTSIVEWGNTNETWQPWPEPVFYKLFLDPEGRNASLTATKIEIWSRNFFFGGNFDNFSCKIYWRKTGQTWKHVYL